MRKRKRTEKRKNIIGKHHKVMNVVHLGKTVGMAVVIEANGFAKMLAYHVNGKRVWSLPSYREKVLTN